LELHRATNQVYGLYTAEALTVPLADWTPIAELWPTNATTNVLTFNVPATGDIIFYRIIDWTDYMVDNLPAWWMFYWLGSLNHSASEWDATGTKTLGEAFTNGVAPTVFNFTGMAVTNPYVASSSVPLQWDVAGWPYYQAVLLDDTNFAHAVWQEYAGSKVTVNVGLAEGWHELWVGLRGHGDDPTNAVWQWTRVKLDFTPPTLVLTSPTNAVVSVPVLQLTGYSAEAVQSIRYDLSNAAGSFTNQPVLITGQSYSADTWEFTTNFFQAFDVRLTNGENALTVYAMDRAGNVTTLTTNVWYVPDTNPPTLRLDWPQNGMVVCGSALVVQGWVSDPTAGVTASLNGTNVFPAAVGRDGVFWVENVPLSAGTNYLSLTATDTAGHATTTNLILFTGDSGLTMDPITPNQTTVTGKIQATNATVWVNGVQATVNGNTWTAQNVPLFPNANLVQAMAVPNDGNTNGQNAAATVVNDGVFVSGYDWAYEHQVQDGWNFRNVNMLHWADSSGGQGRNEYVTDITEPAVDVGTISWPASFWPQPVPSETVMEVYNGMTNTLFTNPPGNVAIVYEHCDAGFAMNLPATTPPAHETFQQHRQTALTLATGGAAGSTAMNLWLVSASAVAEALMDDFGTFPDDIPVGWPLGVIPFPQISVGVFGPLDAEGNAFKLLPDNTQVDVTPQAVGNNHYLFYAYATKYKLVHQTEYTAAGNTNNDRTTIGIGEAVDFSGMPSQTMWSVSGNGRISSTNGNGTIFTANMSPGSATVTAHVGNVEIPTTFSIVAPRGFKTTISSSPGLGTLGTNQIGQRTIYNVDVTPKTVSFNNV
jgi:hypothetical protein